MEELREKIAKIILDADDEYWSKFSEKAKEFWLEDADKILALFQDWLKQQIEKMEVAPQFEYWGNSVAEGQLQDVKDKLLRMME